MLGMRWGQDETGQPPAHGAHGALAGSSWWVCLEEMEGQGQLTWGRWRGHQPCQPCTEWVGAHHPGPQATKEPPYGDRLGDPRQG